MRIFILFIFLQISALVPLSAQSVNQSSILAAEEQRFKHMEAKDTAWLRQNLDDELVYLHSNGLRETKEQHLHSIGHSEIVYQKIDWQPGAEARQYGKIALTNGQIHVKGILRGNPFEIKLLYSAVYRRKKGKWRLLNWQSTRLQ